MERISLYDRLVNENLAKWHEDYLKHKKWVQDFNNNKWQSYKNVARYNMAIKYELWLPDHLIENSSGLADLENTIKQLIKASK